MFTDYLNLTFANGAPQSTGVLKMTPEDFQVEEIPLAMPSGEGEHLFLWIEKRNATTEQVVKELVDLSGLAPRAVSYAGLKDRQALSRQWISLHAPGQDFPDAAQWAGDNWRVLNYGRHHKKLRKGNLRGNHFKLSLRSIANPEAVNQRLAVIQQQGVPNYFTAQRFGHLGQNLQKAAAMLLEGRKVKNRFLNGIYISAIRSYLFNKIISERIRRGVWQGILPGDVLQLSGTRSHFTAEDNNIAELSERLKARDINPCGILWGTGKQSAAAQALNLQTQVLQPYTDYLAALERRKVERAYRAGILWPDNMRWRWLTDEHLQLAFTLPPGSYATAVVRELIDM